MNIIRIVAVIVLNPNGKFLIMKRSSDKKIHANLWNLPSGKIGKGESLEDAGIRETFEETGLKVDFPEVGLETEIEISKELKLEMNYLLARTTDTEVKLNWENSEYKWVTPKESLDFEFAVSHDEVERVLKNFKLL